MLILQRHKQALTLPKYCILHVQINQMSCPPRANSQHIILGMYFRKFQFLLQTASIFAFDLQFIQRTLPKVFPVNCTK